MNRNLIIRLLVGAFILGLAAAPAVAQDNIKIAVVDLERVVAMSKYGQDLQAKLRKFEEEVQTENAAMTEQAKAIQQQAAEGAQSLSVEKLDELQKQYEDKTIEIRRFRERKQREGQQMQQDGLKEIEQALAPVFEAIKTENGYDLILNNTPGFVVMANEKVDITQMVVDRLNG